MNRLVVAFLILVTISGCSTTPTAFPKTSGPAIVVVRDTGFVGSGCKFEILVDGESVGEVGAGQMVVKNVQDGQHRVAINNTTTLCSNVKMSKVVEVKGSPAVFRIGVTSNFQTIFDQVE